MTRRIRQATHPRPCRARPCPLACRAAHAAARERVRLFHGESGFLIDPRTHEPTPRRAAPSTDLGFPEGNAFAFTILDDTDDATVENVAPIYRLLDELGFRTTKTVWAVDCAPEEKGPFFAAETLQDPAYLSLVRRLVDRGFELAFHNATMGSSRRARTEAALAFLKEAFGSLPRLHCNHGLNRENLYWGPERYRTLLLRLAARAERLIRGGVRFEGERPDSPFFWGDISLETFSYVRAFAFARLNTDSIPPGRPFSDPSTPWVRRWFNTSDAPDVHAFKRLVQQDAVDDLHARGGYCILSTHLGKGFVRDGRVDPDVEVVLRYLAGLPGWFVPVSVLLDHLLETRGGGPMTFGQRLRLELDHIFDRVSSRRNR